MMKLNVRLFSIAKIEMRIIQKIGRQTQSVVCQLHIWTHGRSSYISSHWFYLVKRLFNDQVRKALCSVGTPPSGLVWSRGKAPRSNESKPQPVNPFSSSLQVQKWMFYAQSACFIGEKPCFKSIALSNVLILKTRVQYECIQSDYEVF